MIGLLLETERCLDGLRLVDGFYRPLSDRREPVHVVTANLEDPVVLQFLNARDDLVPFMSGHSAGSVFTRIRNETDGVESESFVNVGTVAFWQAQLRQMIASAGGPDPVDALVSLSHPPIGIRASFHLRDGKPQMLLQCERLLEFMKMEAAMVALEGAKPVTCEHCRNLFLTGPSTGRRIHAMHCSDKCRVAAMRARKTSAEPPLPLVTVSVPPVPAPLARKKGARNVNPKAKLEVQRD
jgi:hypothetical protein